MKSIIILLTTGLIAYAIEILLVGGFLAFLIQKRGKEYSWKFGFPCLMVFFALNEIYYIPAVITADVNFTINNNELANFLELSANSSLTSFLLEDIISIMSWFLEAACAIGIARFLIKKPANNKINRTGNTSAF